MPKNKQVENPLSLKKNSQGYSMRPCPKCGSYEVEAWDCGYSRFNPGGVKCKCGYEYEAGYVGCNDGEQDAVKCWNNHCKSRAEANAIVVADEAKAALHRRCHAFVRRLA